MTSVLEGVGVQRHTLATSSSGIRPSYRCTGGGWVSEIFLVAPKNSCPHQHLNPRLSSL